MKNQISFDLSLNAFVKGLTTLFSIETVKSGWILRDANGRLTFIYQEKIDEKTVSTLNMHLQKQMPDYCREDCLLHIDFPGVRRILDSTTSFIEVMSINLKKGVESLLEINLIDQRIVGQDWLTPPAAGWQPPQPARLVFASLKGGVGRSTGLAILAADLSQKGKKVLAIDLDLEAPGIGTMLLKHSDQPKYGVLDWFVERGVHGVDWDFQFFLADMIGSSHFASNAGLIDVVPAVGRISDEYPQNVLAKIARAYLDVPNSEGASLGFLQQTQQLIQALSKLKNYDVILIDARAGLNESTAAALLGLGADVLLFGIDTPQTFSSYRYLLSHLARFSRDENDDWLYRLRMIHAKASRDTEAQIAFRDRAYDIFKEFLYRDLPILDSKGQLLLDKHNGLPLSPKKEFGLNEPEGPHFAWPILSDANFAEFDPCGKNHQLKPEFYSDTYSGLIAGVDALLNSVGENN